MYFDLGDRLSFSLVRSLSDVVLVNSKAVWEKFSSRLDEGRFRLAYYSVGIGSGHESGHVLPRTQNGPLNTVQVGFLAPWKRQEDAIRAVGLLVGRGLDVRLRLLGRSHRGHRSTLRRLAEELGVADRVEFLEFTPDPSPHVAAADVALMCSLNEAFGRVTVEAMKLGKPVVGADSGGTPELITDGWNGFLYRPGDAVDLSLKLEALYSDRALVEQLGANARSWATATFTEEAFASALLDAFADATRVRRA